MSDVALTANEVGVLATYIAPGYFARFGFRARVSGPARTTGEVLIISVVLSLPLVALAGPLIPGSHEPTRVLYVVPLLLGSLLAGYLVGWLRGTRLARSWLEDVLDYRATPWTSIYVQLFDRLPSRTPVTIALTDGRQVRGVPSVVPHTMTSPLEEIYLADVSLVEPTGTSRDVEGLIVPLRTIASIELPADPMLDAPGAVEVSSPRGPA